MPHLEEVERTATDASPEVIGITETWLNSTVTNNMVAITGYNISHFDHTKESGKHGGSSLVFYHKTNIACEHIPNSDHCDRTIECLWIRLRLTSVKPIYYGLIYRPPTGNVLNFWDKLENICLELRTEHHCEINILGDINLDLDK